MTRTTSRPGVHKHLTYPPIFAPRCDPQGGVPLGASATARGRRLPSHGIGRDHEVGESSGYAALPGAGLGEASRARERQENHAQTDTGEAHHVAHLPFGCQSESEIHGSAASCRTMKNARRSDEPVITSFIGVAAGATIVWPARAR